jgi:hypothetical protein
VRSVGRLARAAMSSRTDHDPGSFTAGYLVALQPALAAGLSTVRTDGFATAVNAFLPGLSN